MPRRFQYDEYKTFFDEKIHDLFKLVSISTNFKIRIQTLLFIFQVQNHGKQLSDRYYRTLYELVNKYPSPYFRFCDQSSPSLSLSHARQVPLENQ